MIKQSNAIVACFLAVVMCLGVGSSDAASHSASQVSRFTAPKINFVVHTDRTRYSLSDGMTIYAFLANGTRSVLYMDRRMFWTGLSGGLGLYITDEHGNALPARFLSDAMMPPPSEEDKSILVQLDPGFLYGNTLNLIVRDFFPKPGRYSIRVVYKSMLPKALVAPELRDLPALWDDSPEVSSDPVWIEVVQ